MADAERPELPGEDLVSVGLEDLAAGRESIESLLVACARPRLRDLGIEVAAPVDENELELRLYRLLRERHPEDAYPRYGALRRRLASYIHALEAQQGKALRAAQNR